MTLSILSVGRGWIAIDKPVGMSVHNDPGQDAISIVKEALNVDPELKLASHAKDPPSPVHRLDRETSGVLIIATDRAVASKLQKMFSEEDRAITKIYRAIVRGQIAQSGTWSKPLTDKAESRDNPAGKASDRKASTTHYKVLRSNPHLTEIEVNLASGRQHQIRKHASLEKHAVVGDPRYSDQRHSRMMATRFGIQRMLLHAECIVIPALDLEIRASLPPEFDAVFREDAGHSKATPS